MSTIIILVGYNNYFNRRCKREDNPNSYIAASARATSFESSNFNESDGIYAEHTVNWPFKKAAPDYFLVCENTSTINSRWFITEWRKNRGGQYVAKLRRDVVADFFDPIVKSPCFVERGPLPFSSKLIYNPEGFNLNRIKKEEILLKDETERPWIVGYIGRDTPKTSVQSIFHEDQYPTAESLGIIFNELGDPISGGYAKAILPDSIMPEMRLYYENDNGFGTVVTEEERIKCRMLSANSISEEYFGIRGRWGLVSGRAFVKESLTTEAAAFAFKEVLSVRNPETSAKRASLYTNLINGIESIEAGLTNYANIERIRQNPIVQHGNKYYRITVTSSPIDEKYLDVSSNGNLVAAYYDMDYFFDKWKSHSLVAEYILSQTGMGIPYDVGFKIDTLYMTFTEVTPPGVDAVEIKADRNHLDDAPYDMFCMPYSLTNLALAQSIALALGGGTPTSFIKDLQILPFCPSRFILDEEVGLSSQDYSKIMRDSTEVGRLYYCRHSSDTIVINTSIEKKFRDADEATNTKLSNECDMYRLTSPNYSSSFEFSVAKNGGVDSFKATFTYRPISPYIHVQPIFKNMYGDINNDVRGLILAGDYSVDMLSDAFTNYQIANKNYENIFNTQIKRLDIVRGYQRIGAIAGAVTGAISGAGSGFSTGMLLGGGHPIAGAVGGVIGGAASAVGGAIDYQMGEELYKINRQYSFDMYGYNLGNIQAMPDTLTKISSYTIDNKYFPMVEVYSCTDEEVEIVRNKLKYQSFAIMGISTIDDVLGGTYGEDKFVKGQMIRITGEFFEDEHMANEIYSEIAKGVYF